MRGWPLYEAHVRRAGREGLRVEQDGALLLQAPRVIAVPMGQRKEHNTHEATYNCCEMRTQSPKKGGGGGREGQAAARETGRMSQADKAY